MKYALVFCLFFAVDILFEGQFQSFGLMPVDGLMAAVILFSGIFILKIPALPGTKIANIFKALLAFQLGILFISRLWTSLGTLAKFQCVFSIGFFFIFSDIFRKCMISLSLLFIVLFHVKQKERYQLHLWIYFYCWAVIFRYGFKYLVQIMNISHANNWFYRYQGFLDLPVLFSLLMCVHVIIKEKYLHEYQLAEDKIRSDSL